MNERSAAEPASASRIAEATTADEIAKVFPVMRVLRANVQDERSFLEQVTRQMREGFRLAFLENGGEVKAVAGFRIHELLFSGRTLYVDDLVTLEGDRSRGFGSQLFDWLVAVARREGCSAFALDSGVQRFDAHRFYLSKRMKIAAHHFTLEL